MHIFNSSFDGVKWQGRGECAWAPTDTVGLLDYDLPTHLFFVCYSLFFHEHTLHFAFTFLESDLSMKYRNYSVAALIFFFYVRPRLNSLSRATAFSAWLCTTSKS